MDLCRKEKVSHCKMYNVLKPCRYILANGNVEISCHLVDIQVSMYPAGIKGSGTVLTMGKMSNTMWREYVYHNYMEGSNTSLFILVSLVSTITQF